MAAVACAFALSGCAGVHLTQDRDTAIIRAGSYDSGQQPAAPYSGHFATYAAFAVIAYGDRTNYGSRWTDLIKATGRLAEVWIKGWRLVDVREGPLPCPAGNSHCGLRVGGLVYWVWQRDDCREVVIAFRGTNFDQADDILSNLHWLTRPLPIRDQYQQVEDNISVIVDRAIAACPRARPHIVTVGHSLGGGLAQKAAYVDARIRTVYAFDPSFVTGRSDDVALSTANSARHKVDHVYEFGEILSVPRFIVRLFDPAPACGPQLRLVRFNLLTGTLNAQHSMVALASRLVLAAGTPARFRRIARPLPRSPEADPSGACRTAVRVAASPF